MHGLRLLAFASLVIAAAAFAATTYFASDWNWRPVQLPLPGPNLEVALPFEIVNGGRFRLEVTVPTKLSPSDRVSLAILPPVLCTLRMEITGPSGFRIERPIARLERGGQYSFGGVDLYNSEPLSLPTRGEYIFRLSNLASSEPFGERGAMIALTRYEKGTGAFLNSMLLRWLGWGALACGVILAFVSEVLAASRLSDHAA